MAFVYENDRFQNSLFGDKSNNQDRLNTSVGHEEYKEIEKIKKERAKNALDLKFKKTKAVPFGFSVSRSSPKGLGKQDRLYSIPTNRNPPIIVYRKPTASFASNCARFQERINSK